MWSNSWPVPARTGLITLAHLTTPSVISPSFLLYQSHYVSLLILIGWVGCGACHLEPPPHAAPAPCASVSWFPSLSSGQSSRLQARTHVVPGQISGSITARILQPQFPYLVLRLQMLTSYLNTATLWNLKGAKFILYNLKSCPIFITL